MRAPRWLVLTLAIGIAAAALVAIVSWNPPASRVRSVSAPPRTSSDGSASPAPHAEIDDASRRLLEEALREAGRPTEHRE